MSSLMFEHKSKSKSSSNGNRTWLTTCSPEYSLQSDDLGSPPLEGGEALSEFLIDAHTNLEKSHLQLLTNLPSYLEDHNAECLQDVFPAIQEALPTAQPEVQLAASNSFLTILEKELVPYATFTQTFLQSILASVDSKDPIVANAWVETLLEVIDLLPKDVIRQDILSLAVSKGQISQPISSRLSCCRMLGKICAKFEPYVIKKEILPVVQGLCQDVDYEVRGCMCRQLDAVSKGLGLEATKSAILPELVELANDEESYVQLAGIETVVNMLSLLDDETCTQIIEPLVKKFCENAIKSQDIMLPVVAKQLGKLCHGLSVNLTSEQKHWFLEFYRQVAQLGLPNHQDDNSNHTRDNGRPPMPDIVPRLDNHHQERSTECRYYCAYNFPAMVLFSGPGEFKEQLYETFHDLACDPHLKVRRTIACGLHEVAKLLGPCVHIIHGELISLLQDESLEVLDGLIPHLPITLEALAKEGTMGNENKLTGAEVVMSAVIMCEEEISKTSNWRLHAEILEKLSCLPKCLSSNLIFHKFVPLFFQKLFTARPLPCRLAAASTLLVFLRSNPRQDHRQEICERLIEELCNGKSCHSRMLFITICDLVMDIFSKAFFKENFFMPLLGLAADPVANVRLSLCGIIPRLKTLLRFPVDAILLQDLEICVGKLMIDEEDRDVSAAVRTAILELDKIEVALETPILRRSTHFSSGHSQNDGELDEQLQKEEEQYLLELEERRSSPVSVFKSPDRRSLRASGRIPVRRSVGGKESPETKRFSLTGESVSAKSESLQAKSEESFANVNKNRQAPIQTSSLSITSPTTISRIPTLARSQPDCPRTSSKGSYSSTPALPRKYSSPPRPATNAEPAVQSRTSANGSVPSPEAVRRAMMLRRPMAVTPVNRRKSADPGTKLPSVSRNSTTNSRLSGNFSKPTINSLSHIPRYPSSSISLPASALAASPPSSSKLSPVLPDDCFFDSIFLLHDSERSLSRDFHPNLPFLSLSPTNPPLSPPPPPDDYELELLDVYEEDEESNEGFSPQLEHTFDTRRGAYGGSSGGGGKIFAQWSQSHLPFRRSATPPVSGNSMGCGGKRTCRSASSSPTNSPRSFIPRYIGGKSFYAFRFPNPSTHCRAVRYDSSFLSRTKSSSQLMPSVGLRRTTSPNFSGSLSKGGGKASSLPGTPRSASPTQHPNLDHSKIPRFTPSVAAQSKYEASAAKRNEGDSGAATTSRSVRNLVRELESLSSHSKSTHSPPCPAPRLSLANKKQGGKGLGVSAANNAK